MEDRPSSRKRTPTSPSQMNRSNSRTNLPDSRRLGEDFYGGRIEYAESGHSCYIRVIGLGTLQNGSSLRAYLKEAKQRGMLEYVFDLERCQGMDSSFMGLLAGIALDMGETAKGIAMLINVDEYNRGLLNQLGVLELISEGTADIPGNAVWVSLDPQDATALDRARMAIDSHDTLTRIKPENRHRFEALLKRLKDEFMGFLRSRSKRAEGTD